MIKRSLQWELIKALQNVPVVALLGSRQVGKTTLALQGLTASWERDGNEVQGNLICLDCYVIRGTDDSKPRITLRFIRATMCFNKRVLKYPARSFGTI